MAPKISFTYDYSCVCAWEEEEVVILWKIGTTLEEVLELVRNYIDV